MNETRKKMHPRVRRTGDALFALWVGTLVFSAIILGVEAAVSAVTASLVAVGWVAWSIAANPDTRPPETDR